MAAVFRALRVSKVVRSIACRPCTCEVACSSSYSTPYTYVGDSYRGVHSFARHRHRKQAQKTEESIDQEDEPEMLSDTVEDSFHDQAHIRVPVDLDYKWVPANLTSCVGHCPVSYSSPYHLCYRSPTERVWPASRHQQKCE